MTKGYGSRFAATGSLGQGLLSDLCVPSKASTQTIITTCNKTTFISLSTSIVWKQKAEMMALRAPRTTPAVAQRSGSRVSRRFIPVRAQAEKSALAKVRE